jgi:hypothetical protein
MDKANREKLNEILKDNDDVVDNTSFIREQKYSEKIKLDVEKLLIFRSKNQTLMKNDVQKYEELLKCECFFLSTNYPEIFSKLKEDTLDMKLMFKMIEIYRDIEDGKLDQHEASFKIGSILKKIYVDTVINTNENIKPSKKITYSQWFNKVKQIEEKIKC